MKEKRNLHLKMQEMCDCYAQTDYLKAMSDVPQEQDPDEGAMKWLALAALHGVNDMADKIKITRTEDGSMDVVAQYRKHNLPNPGQEIGGKILEALYGITHLEDEGEIPLSLGLGSSNIELKIKVKKKDGKEQVTLKFPE